MAADHSDVLPAHLGMVHESAFAAGLIATPTIPVEWAPPKFDLVNPLQDATTDLLEVRSGLRRRSR